MDNNLTKSNSRNYGIDLLRIVCMILIPIFHLLGHGGVLDAAKQLSANYYLAWLLEIACYCAVNCFAIISGYVGYGKKVKYSNIINMHFQVSFYTIGITAIFCIINPANINFHNIMTAVFPAAFSTYWYFTAYFVLFFMMPFLNMAIEKFDKKTLQILLISMLFVFSLIPTFLLGDLAGLQGGYCFLWLAVMYTVGAYIKKYGIDIKYKNSKNLLLYAAFVLITWLSKVIIENITIMIFGSPKMSYYLVKYTSPTIIACAIFLFLFFENLKCGKTMIKFISFFAPISFGVYLIHAEPLLVDNFLTGKFVFLANLNPIVMMLALIGLGLAIWLICSLIDKLRLELFKLLKIKELSVKTENLIGKILRKIYEYAKALVVRNNQKA